MSGDEEIERAIAAYIDAHPDAMDTLEGISQWWLRRRFGVTRVANVLARMATRRELETVGPPETLLYRRGRSTAREAGNAPAPGRDQ